MKLSDICIRRPVLSTVLSLVVILIGIVTFYRLPVRQYPNIDKPVITISTRLDGASPEIIAQQITQPIEEALSGLEGLYLMTSESLQGESKVKLQFEGTRRVDDAANDVRDKLGAIREKLPRDTRDYVIRKADADSEPVVYVIVYSNRHDTNQISDFVKQTIESQLQVLPGVAFVDVFGGGDYKMYINLDPIKLAGYNLTPDDVADALANQNVEKPLGSISTTTEEFTITTRTPMRNERHFDELIVSQKGESIVRLSDVGYAKLDAINRLTRVRYKDQPCVSIGIHKQATSNPLEITRELRKRLPDLERQLTKGMKIEIGTDNTFFIERSLDQVYKTLIEATLLVFLIILIFLRSFRAVSIPLVTIPISLIGAFGIMFALGYSVNILTLLALVLAIGLVVDDAIVVLENIYRHIEEGMKPMAAAFKGMREIGFAVIAMTLTLAAVFTPLSLTPGQVGRTFTEFAMTLAGAVIISGFAALTLSPMMCSRLLKGHEKPTKHKIPLFNTIQEWGVLTSDKIGNGLDWLESFYTKLLRSALRGRFLVLLLGLLVSGSAYWIFKNMRTELAPEEDQGTIRVSVMPYPNTTLEFLDRYIKDIEAILRKVPEVESILAEAHKGNRSTIIANLVPWEKRKRSVQEIVADIKDDIYETPGVSTASAYAYSSKILSGASDTPVSVRLKSRLSEKELDPIKEDFRNRLANLTIGGQRAIKDLRTFITQTGYEYVVTVDREKASQININPTRISQTVDYLLGTRSPTKFIWENKKRDVVLQLDEPYRQRPEDIFKVQVKGQVQTEHGTQEVMSPISELVDIERKLSPNSIERFEGQISAHFIGSPTEIFGLGEVLETIKKMEVPDGVSITFDGESRRFLNEQQSILLIFVLAIAFIYLVLSAQYESFIDPLIILFSVPLSLAGAIFLLKMTNQTINIYSQIGFVTLIGLITKHGILIVDFANKLKADGLSKIEAAIEASRLRLRPILMTTFAMVLGAIPLAIASGAGAESRVPIGMVIVGGLTLGTLFTLFVVPAVYTFLSTQKAAKDLHGFHENDT